LDWESDRDKAMDEFDEKYGNHFSHFLHQTNGIRRYLTFILYSR
jgi:hypothetical protein